jgi:hypothetical protein
MRVGRVTRQITRALVGSGRPMTTRELCGWAYPRLKGLCAHHLYSVRRAAEHVADRVGRRVPGGIVWALKPGPSVPQTEVLSPQAIENKGADME